MDTLTRTIRIVEKVSNIIAGIMLLSMMFLGAADVIGRYIFNRPITGAMETSQLLMGGMVFLAWAYTLSKRGHVTVDIIFVLYPKRVQAILYFVMMIIALVLFALIFWQSATVAISDWQAGKLVRIILIPIAPFKALVSLGALLLCLECIIQIIQTLPIMSREKEG